MMYWSSMVNIETILLMLPWFLPETGETHCLWQHWSGISWHPPAGAATRSGLESAGHPGQSWPRPGTGISFIERIFNCKLTNCLSSWKEVLGVVVLAWYFDMDECFFLCFLGFNVVENVFEKDLAGGLYVVVAATLLLVVVDWWEWPIWKNEWLLIFLAREGFKDGETVPIILKLVWNLWDSGPKTPFLEVWELGVVNFMVSTLFGWVR